MTPVSPPPVTGYRPEFLPAYLSNGLVGLRVPRIPQLGGLLILNGFAGIDADSGSEGFARAPYPLAGDIEVNRVSMARAPERATLREQAYDFGCGELRTLFEFDAAGVLALVEVVTFCSRTLPTLVLQQVHVSVDRACDVVVSAGVDQANVPGTLKARDTSVRGSDEDPVDGSMLWESNGGLGLAGVAYVTGFDGAEAERSLDHDPLASLRTSYAFRARSGRRYRLRQIAGLVPDTSHHLPDTQAVRLVFAGVGRGFDRLRRENAAAWEELWRGRIVLEGPSRWQELLDAAYFYLQTSVHL